MYRLCQHTKANGLRCQSPALRTDDFCYSHTAFRRQQRELAAERQRPTEFIAPNFNSRGDFIGMAPVKPRDIDMTRGVIRKPLDVDLGLLEDAASIQLAISNVLSALAHGRLETRRASVLLYGLQLASNNCKTLDPMKSGIYEQQGEGEGTLNQPSESSSSHPESSENCEAPAPPAQCAEESHASFANSRCENPRTRPPNGPLFFGSTDQSTSSAPPPPEITNDVG